MCVRGVGPSYARDAVVSTTISSPTSTPRPRPPSSPCRRPCAPSALWWARARPYACHLPQVAPTDEQHTNTPTHIHTRTHTHAHRTQHQPPAPPSASSVGHDMRRLACCCGGSCTCAAPDGAAGGGGGPVDTHTCTRTHTRTVAQAGVDGGPGSSMVVFCTSDGRRRSLPHLHCQVCGG
jgi:hypothetical protein